ncbi:hypothetical protein ACJX0J_014473, partial [Zea mays]
QREVPSSNIALHSAHCARNLQKCEHCGDMVARKLMDEHYDENHAPMNCSLCKHTVERELWDLHTGIQCPQRMLACQYCQFELPAVDLFEHQDLCGNRTEYCQSCRKYIRLREWIGHELQFHTILNAASELSRQHSATWFSYHLHMYQLRLHTLKIMFTFFDWINTTPSTAEITTFMEGPMNSRRFRFVYVKLFLSFVFCKNYSLAMACLRAKISEELHNISVICIFFIFEIINRLQTISRILTMEMDRKMAAAVCVTLQLLSIYL